MTTPPRERWTLILEAQPSAVPVAVRIRRLLKLAGRSLRLRAVRLWEPGTCPQSPAVPGPRGNGSVQMTTFDGR